MKEDNTYYDEMDGLNLPGSLRVNPFVTPENYFENLSSSILSQVRLHQVSDPEKTDFSVPKAYFSQLTDHIQLHLRLAPYKGSVGTTWDVPKGYFDDMSKHIIFQVRLETSGKQEAFGVPMGYFENLSERVETKVFEEKLKEQVSADGFGIPVNYADTLKHKIIAKAIRKEEHKTKVRKLNFNAWVRYAAAACAAIVLGVVSYNAINNGSQANFIESHLSSIPDEEIINYLSASNNSDDILYIMEYFYQPDESAGICSQIEESDIEDYLNYTL